MQSINKHWDTSSKARREGKWKARRRKMKCEKEFSSLTHAHVVSLPSWKFSSLFSSHFFFSCLCFARRIIDDKHRFRCTTHSHHKRRIFSWDDGGNITDENKRRIFSFLLASRFFSFPFDAIKDHKLDCYWGFFYYLIYIVLYAEVK